MEKIKIIGEFDLKREQDRRIYETSGLAPTLRAENHDVKILVGIIQNMGEYSNEDKTRQDKTRQDKGSLSLSDCQVVVLGQMDNTLDHTFESANRVYDKDQLCPTIPTCAGGNIQPKVIEEARCVGGLSADKWGTQYHQQDRVYMGDIALAIPAQIPEGSYKYIEVKQATKGGSIKCKVGGCYDASYPDSSTPRGRVQNGGDVTPTITAEGSENINYIETEYRIRKLTPKECWRLMGYTDEDFEKAASVNSNSQLYKQAGNAIVKQVLMAIFSQML